MIVMADHSQAPVTARRSHSRTRWPSWASGPVALLGEASRRRARIAVCPSQRAAMVYALNESERDAMRASVAGLALAIEGVDLVIWLERDAHEAPREGVIASPDHGELRFARAAPCTIGAACPGASTESSRSSVRASRTGVLLSPDYPDALGAGVVGADLPDLGEVLLSAAAGYEFIDWGRQAHVGGGSHGSLHASDSLGALILSGVPLPRPEPSQWAIRDVAPLVAGHFGLAPAGRCPRRDREHERAGARRRARRREPRRVGARSRACAASPAGPDRRAGEAIRRDLLALRSAMHRVAAIALCPRLDDGVHGRGRGRHGHPGRAPRRLHLRADAARPAARRRADPLHHHLRSADPGAALRRAAAGRRLSADQVLAIAGALPKMRAVRAEYRGSYGGAYLKHPFRWQVSYFSRNGKKEIGQVIIDDLSGRVLEQWTGFQVAWTMARGYPGAFGRHVNALYMWLPLCVLFLLPFLIAGPSRCCTSTCWCCCPSRSRSRSSTTPTSTPRSRSSTRRCSTCWRACSPCCGARPASAEPGPGGPLRLLVPAPWLAVAVVFLIGFRVGLNVTDGNVIDVGYAGVIGAQRIVDGKPLYGSYPTDNEHGDTYGPVNYEAYVPFEQIFGCERHLGRPARGARAPRCSSTCSPSALLFLLGRRMRGPTLGVALAYAWVSYPVHAVRAGEQLQRHARGGAGAGGAAGRHATARRPATAARGGLSRRSPA